GRGTHGRGAADVAEQAKRGSMNKDTAATAIGAAASGLYFVQHVGTLPTTKGEWLQFGISAAFAALAYVANKKQRKSWPHLRSRPRKYCLIRQGISIRVRLAPPSRLARLCTSIAPRTPSSWLTPMLLQRPLRLSA